MALFRWLDLIPKRVSGTDTGMSIFWEAELQWMNSAGAVRDPLEWFVISPSITNEAVEKTYSQLLDVRHEGQK